MKGGIFIKDFYEVKELIVDDSICYVPVGCNRLESYNHKVVQCGDIIETYSYSNTMYRNYSSKRLKSVLRHKNDNWHGKDEKNLYRARKQIRRLVWCNISKYSKFLTLTYADNVQDMDKALYDFKIFKKYMSRCGYKLKYLYVTEYQERGSIHFHLVIFNNEYIPWETIRRCWRHGVIDIHKIRDVKNLGAYVCKYLTKDTLAAYNSRSYSCSRGLNRPVEKYYAEKKELPLEQTTQPTYENTYDVTHGDIIANSCVYRQYRVDK